MISEIEIRLRADIARLQQDMDQARKAVGGGLDKINAAVGKTVGLLGGLAVGAAAVSFASFIKGAIDATDALNDLSARTQVSVEDLGGLAYAAKLSGTELDAVAGAVNKLGQNVGKETDKFRALGVTATEPLEAFKQLAEVFKAIQDPQQRAAFGAAALGKSWAEVAPLLDAGADGIDNLVKRGKELSGVTQQSAEQAAALNDKLDELSFRAQGLGKRLAAEVVPALDKTVTAVTAAYDESGKLAALWTSLGAVGAFLFTDEFASASVQLKGLNKELAQTLQDLQLAKEAPAVGFLGRWLFGETEGQLESKVASLRAQIKGLQGEVPAKDELAEFMAGVDKAISDGQKAAKAAEFLQAEEIAAARKKAAEEAQAAAKKETDAYRSTISAIREKLAADQAEMAAGVPLLEAQKERIKLDQDLKEGKLVLTAAHEKEVRAALEALEVQEKLRRSAEQTKKATEELNEERADDYRAALQEAKAAEALVENFGKTKQAIERATLARMEERLAQRGALELDKAEVEQLERLIEAKKRAVDAGDQLEVLERQKAATEEATKAQQDMWKAIEDTAHDTFVSILDGGKNVGQRLKDSLKNTFFDWLYQQTLKKWIINIGTSMSGGAAGGGGDVASGLQQAAAIFGGGSTAGAGGSSSALSLLSTGKSVYDAITKGFAGVSASIGTMVSGFGNAIGSSGISAFGTGMGLTSEQAAAAAAQYSAAGAGSTGAGLTAGAGFAKAIPIIGWIIAGMQAANGFMKQGFTPGRDLNAAGKVVGAPTNFEYSSMRKLGVGSSLANIISGAAITTKLFGRAAPRVESQGISGMFGPEGFSGETYQNWLAKGGLFRSDKRGTNKQAVSGESASILSESFGNVKAMALAFADALGAPTDQITTYTRTIKMALTSDDTKNQEIFNQLMNDIGNDLAYRLVPNLDKFQQKNETASAALARLTNNYVSLDAVLKTIGTTFGAVGVGSLEARERLITLSGGLEQLATNAAGFAQNFLTTAERQKPVMDAVTKTLADMGLGWVDTREEFKQVALATDKTTEAGAKQFAGLMALQAAFASLYPSTEELTAALKAQEDAQKAAAEAAAQAAAEAAKAQREKMLQGLEGAVSDTLANLGNLVDAQKQKQQDAFDDLIKGINTGIDTTNKRVAKLRELSSALASFRPAQTGNQAVLSRQVGAAQITTALAIAKASGVLPSADSLQFALSSLSQDISGEFATSEDYQRAQLRAANDIAALNNLAAAQTTIEERTLQALQEQKVAAQTNFDAQMGVLNSLLTTAREQAAAATKTADSVARASTLPEALGEFSRAITALVTGRGADLPQSSLTQLSQGGTMGQENVDALLYELQTLNTQMANLKSEMARTAANTGASAMSNLQLAQQFDQVSAGGNALFTELAPGTTVKTT